MIAILVSFLLFSHPALAADGEPGVSASPSPAEGEYEIDYEEEPDASGDSEAAPIEPVAPVNAPKKAAKGQGGPAVQGSRAKDRFTPILKSETKSIYQKGGKHLDVDPD